MSNNVTSLANAMSDDRLMNWLQQRIWLQTVDHLELVAAFRSSDDAKVFVDQIAFVIGDLYVQLGDDAELQPVDELWPKDEEE